MVGEMHVVKKLCRMSPVHWYVLTVFTHLCEAVSSRDQCDVDALLMTVLILTNRLLPGSAAYSVACLMTFALTLPPACESEQVAARALGLLRVINTGRG